MKREGEASYKLMPLNAKPEASGWFYVIQINHNGRKALSMRYYNDVKGEWFYPGRFGFVPNAMFIDWILINGLTWPKLKPKTTP